MNKRGKTRLILGLIVLSIALVSAVTAAAMGSVESKSRENDALGTPVMAADTYLEHIPDPSPAPSGFVLKSHNGFIAVFSSESSKTPAMITEIELSTLRDSDQALLEDGIYANTQEELMLLLEDFGS